MISKENALLDTSFVAAPPRNGIPGARAAGFREPIAQILLFVVDVPFFIGCTPVGEAAVIIEATKPSPLRSALNIRGRLVDIVCTTLAVVILVTV